MTKAKGGDVPTDLPIGATKVALQRLAAGTSQEEQRAAGTFKQVLGVVSVTHAHGGLGPQVTLSAISVFVLDMAANDANFSPRPLPFNEGSTVKLGFWVKNRPES